MSESEVLTLPDGTRVLTFTTLISPEDFKKPETDGSVKLVAHGDATRSLRFRAGFYMGHGVEAAVRSIGTINNYEPGRVMMALDTLARHEQLAHEVEVGFEGTPVLYLRLSSKADEELVVQIMRGADADEIDVRKDDTGHRTLRAWWD